MNPAHAGLTTHALTHDALRPIYAFMATEPLLLDEAVATLQRRVLDRHADFNGDTVELGPAALPKLLAAAQTAPMLAPRRLVHGRLLHRLPAGEHAGLIAYIQDPCPSTVLVLTGHRLDGRTKLCQALSHCGALRMLEPPRPAQLPQWVRERAHSMQVRIDHDASALLADLIGPELGVLQRSLDMLALLAGPDCPITIEHVSEGIAASRVHSVFELTAALGRHDWPQASVCMRHMVAAGVSALLIVAMVARQLRLLLQSQGWRGPPAALAQELGVRPFVAADLLQQVRAFSRGALCDALSVVAEADLHLKRNALNAPLVLDHMLAKLLPSGPRAGTPGSGPANVRVE